MGSKGSQTTTTSSAPNPQAMAAYTDILSRAQGVANTPYTAYGGELTAPVNAQQSTGIANINSNWNYAQPYMQTAAGYAQDAATPLTSAQIQQYMSPYTQSVVDATQAQFNNQNQQQVQQSRGQAIAQGALGGNRQGIAEAELANQQQKAQAPVIAGLYNQGYTTSLNTALSEQQARAQGAYSLGNIGVSGQNAALTGANAQIGAGSLQQQTQQAQDAAAYQQFVNQQAYPFQTLQWLSGIGTGVGSQMGGTSSSTAPPPNSTGQWLGLGAAGIGAIGQAGGWSALASAAPAALAMLATGGAVRRASGGVAPEGPTTLPESAETLKIQQRQLLSGHRRAQMFPHGTPELPMPRGMMRTQTDSGVFHYDPRRIHEDDIHRHSGAGRENEVLDLGPYSKDDVLKRLHGGEIPVTVVERHPNGTEVRAAIGTHATADRQMAAMNRTKSPGHIVRIEDPRETIGHRLRAAGGRVPGFADGGMPWGEAHGWVPTIGITAGKGAPGAPQAPGQPAPMNKDSLSGLGGAFKGMFNGVGGPTNENQNEGAGLSASDENPSMYYRGGTVGYADGGAPMGEAPPEGIMAPMPYNGAHGWIPRMDIKRGRGAPPAPGVAPAQPQSLANQAKEIGSLANLISNPNSAGPTNQDQNEGAGMSASDENPSMYRRGGSVGHRASGGVGNLPFHAMVPHLAEGGSPYDTNYFDDSFATPIRHDADSYRTLTTPGAMKDYSDRIIADSDYRPQVAEMPMPRSRPEGIAPTYDLPPEIYAGRSRPSAEGDRLAMGFAGDDVVPPGRSRAVPPRVDVVEGDQPSPLDNAAWPQGPRGAPSGYDSMARDERAGPPLDIAQPRGVAPAPSGIDISANSKLWPSLMSAGFGMMASRSPFLGTAVGEGGMAGMQTYANERQREDKIKSEVKKLSQEAEFAQKRLDLQTRTHDDTVKHQDRAYTEQTADQRARSAEVARYHDILGDRKQLRPTGTMVDSPDGPHPIFIDSRTGASIDGITGEPVAADAKIITAPGKAGATQILARELMRDREEQRKTDPSIPPLSMEEAVGLAHRAPDADRGTARRLSLAQGAWKAWNADPTNMGKKNAPEKDIGFWEKRYGVDGAAATPAPAGARPAAPQPAPAAAPAPAAPAAAAPPPPRPASVPPEAKPQRNKTTGVYRWVAPDGAIYSADGVKQ